MASIDPIPLCAPEIRGNEWNYIKECLDAGWISSGGEFVDRLERDIASYLGAKHAVATVSGTAALHTALMVAGIGPDDEVLVSDLTFVAPVNAIRYVGAWPVLIDAEPAHWQMDVDRLKFFLEGECRWVDGKLLNAKTKRRVRAILPVHILGHPVDMSSVVELAEQYDLIVIEDASESLGAKYEKKNVGNIGHISCFSFNANKVISTGGGGAIVTNIEAWADRVRYLTTQAKDDPVEYVHNEIGYNYRLTNILAAMGVAQLEQLQEYVVAKRRIAQTYKDELAGVEGFSFPLETPLGESSWWLFTLRIDASTYPLNSRQLMATLGQHSIQSRPLWRPMHMLAPFSDCQICGGDIAQNLYRDCLSLPSSVGLKETEQQRVIKVLKEQGQGAPR
jgi:perosamine synthetase